MLVKPCLRQLRTTKYFCNFLFKRMCSSESNGKILTLDSMNPHVRIMEYAVRGPIVARAGEIEQELKKGVKKPFTEVIRCNIGDCHAVGQSPIAFIRQVVALISYPKLLEDPQFANDAKLRASRILESCSGHSVGAYSASTGVPVIREDISKYIARRDGYPSNVDDIFLSTGASDAIKSLLFLLNTCESGTGRTGIMIPIPQYPLYTATIAEYNAFPVGYFLKEEDNWSLDIAELQRSITDARSKCKPRAIVVINPGNPTGQVLTKENIKNIIKFAHKERLVILADEVYQHNIYAKTSSFFSFKSVLMEMGAPYSTNQELASFMSVSKGYMGECGFRAGYCEAINLDPAVKAQLYKSISAKLCSSVVGQSVMDVVMNPPQPGEDSYDQFEVEKKNVLDQLKTKASLVTETFNSIEGVSCQTVQGAMYCFPQLVHMPEKVKQLAKEKGTSPDSMFCFELLEETGLCVVPGSGFGQREGTYHFRMTILPPVTKIKKTLETFKEFHAKFIKRYS